MQWRGRVIPPSNRAPDVFLACDPFEVVSAVVFLVAVEMVDLVRTRVCPRDKCFGNERMDSHVSNGAISVELHIPVSMCIDSAGQRSAGASIKNDSVVGEDVVRVGRDCGFHNPREMSTIRAVILDGFQAVGF